MGYYNEAIIKHMMINVAKEGKEAYQKFFNQAMKKFGIKSPSELSDDKKKDFFNYIDKHYKAKNESTKAYAKTLAKMAKDRQLKNISKKDKMLLMKIAQMMKSANENVNEGITVSGYSELSKRGRHMPLAAKELVKALKRQNDKEVIKNIEYIADLSDWMRNTLKNKKFNEGKIKEDLHPYKDFDGFPKKEYNLNLGAFVDHYQKFIKFMKKHREVPDKNKREWALAIRDKVGQGMFSGHMSQMRNIMDLLQMADKYRNLKEGTVKEVGDQHIVAIKDFIGSAMKKAGIRVKKIKPMKKGTTRAIYGAFYTVKAASGNDILPVYVYKNGKIELGVSSAGFWPGKYGDMSRVVSQLKDFKKTDLDIKD